MLYFITEACLWRIIKVHMWGAWLIIMINLIYMWFLREFDIVAKELGYQTKCGYYYKNLTRKSSEDLLAIMSDRDSKNVQKGINDKGIKKKDKISRMRVNGEKYSDDVETYSYEFCDSNFEIENEDDDGNWRNIDTNDLSKLDGRDVMGIEIEKSKICIIERGGRARLCRNTSRK